MQDSKRETFIGSSLVLFDLAGSAKAALAQSFVAWNCTVAAKIGPHIKGEGGDEEEEAGTRSAYHFTPQFDQQAELFPRCRLGARGLCLEQQVIVAFHRGTSNHDTAGKRPAGHLEWWPLARPCARLPATGGFL